MKRLLTCLVFAALPFSAHASTDLAQQWGIEAHRLSQETMQMLLAVDMGQTPEISDTYALDVYRFGRTSADLATWIDTSKGPNDLGCIFRGMASESNDQLEALETEADVLDQRASLTRLATMFADAEIIAVAAQRRTPTTGRVANQMHSVCGADPATILDHLH